MGGALYLNKVNTCMRNIPTNYCDVISIIIMTWQPVSYESVVCVSNHDKWTLPNIIINQMIFTIIS